MSYLQETIKKKTLYPTSRSIKNMPYSCRTNMNYLFVCMVALHPSQQLWSFWDVASILLEFYPKTTILPEKRHFVLTFIVFCIVFLAEQPDIFLFFIQVSFDPSHENKCSCTTSSFLRAPNLRAIVAILLIYTKAKYKVF